MLSNVFTADELSGILKKLSLEKYQPIFEEQEVCDFRIYYNKQNNVKYGMKNKLF